MTRLHLAQLTSLTLHAVVLLAAGTAAPMLSGQLRSSLSVQLVGSAGGEAGLRITHREVTQPRHPVVQRIAPTTLATAQRDDIRIATDTQNTRPPTVPIGTGNTAATPATGVAFTTGDPPADTVNRIKAHLYTDLARYFDYPELARRRGWEGLVMLAVKVASDGQLQQIRVARSSGFAILDDSALQSLRQVDRLSEAATLLNGRQLAMQIPVIYRLQGEP